MVRQPGFAQLHHRGEGPLPIPAAEEEEVSLVVGQLGRLAQVHRVGVADDGRLLRLAEHLPEEHRLHPAAADQVGEHVSRPHGGQLVRIPHQHQPGAGPQGPQQSGKQRQVHHRHLIHDHRVRLQRLLFRLLERHLMGDVVPAHPQHPVDRLGLHAGQLAHALGRPPGGGRQDDLQAHPPEQGHDAPDCGGLAGAGASREDQHPRPGGQLHRLPLQGRIGDALLGLQLVHRPARLGAAVCIRSQQPRQADAGGTLRLPQPPEVAGLHMGHLFLDHRAPFNEAVQSLLHQLRPAVQQLGRGGDQLVPGQEHVAVVFIVAQLKGHRRLEPLVAVRSQPHAHGDPVGDGELHPARLAGEEVGILPHLLQRRVAVLPPQLHSQDRRQLVLGQKGHQPPQAHVPAEALRDLLGLAGGDAFERGQALRLPLQNVQGLRPEPLHNPPRGGGAHPLADA